MINQLGEVHNLPLQTVYGVGRGFYIQINYNEKNPLTLDELPPIFIKKTKLKNQIRCTTEDLVSASLFLFISQSH